MSDMRAMASAETEIVVSPERLCRVLELAITDSPLEQTLGELIGIVESTSRTNVLGSILLLDHDGIHLRHGAAPSLPDAYCQAIDGAEQATMFPAEAGAITRSAQLYFEGTSYFWGGVTPWGADCSGLVQSVYWLHGIQLYRDAWQ